MTEITTLARQVAAGTVRQHDCAEIGCLAAMFGLALDDPIASCNVEEGSSSGS